MAATVLPALVALFVWWFSTGIVLLLNRLPKRNHGRSTLAATALAVAAAAVLYATAGGTDPASAYWGFLAAIVLWGWHELTFLQGQITGPRKIACPADAGLGRRFVMAARTLLYHELAILATLGLVYLLTQGQLNQVGFWTFLVLFAMRLSAKLNIFLGVPSLSEEMLPQELDFLKSYFGRRPINGLFPVSITVATLVGAYVFHLALAPDAGAFVATGYMLVGSLIVLGTVEHWLLVLPLPDAALWRWALSRGEAKGLPENRGYRAVRHDKTNELGGAPLPAAVPGEGRIP